jgi:ribosomal protein S18 acetylase RimI-like enzyme
MADGIGIGGAMPLVAETSRSADELVIRAAASADVAAVSRLDSRITGISKADYWEDMFERYGKRPDRFFLIAEQPGGSVVGFIIGEVRAWEFGSPPSGWIFALGVDPRARLRKIGSRLYHAICACLAESSVASMVRSDDLNMAFFRSQGMMGGPFIQLEMSLDGFAGGQH